MEVEAYLAALARLSRLTPLRLSRLFVHFGNDAERAWRASAAEWAAAGVEQKVVAELWPEKQKIDPAAELAALQKIGARVLPAFAEDFPLPLREIYSAPQILFVRGTFPLPADRYSVAVVGSRVASPYGRQATELLARELALAGVVVVSGLAAGVDALAHTAALSVGGRTVAVLGNGIDQIYPPQNRRLADEILAHGGAIISEYPIGTEPAAYNFPQRNRIVAGLCRGTLVTEGRAKSGSLITAELALEMGRDVFAVPGSIFAETSAGPNALIRAGARPVSSAAEILEALGLTDLAAKKAVQAVVADSPAEARVLAVLSREPCHADELTRAAGLTAAEVGGLLSLLEIKGLAKNLGGGQWVRG